MNDPHYYCVIMAGGLGTRFWPMSRESRPKQFQTFSRSGRSFLQLAYERALEVVPEQNVLVVSLERFQPLAFEDLPNLDPENLLLEPYNRNTASCIAFATYYILKRDPEAVVLVTPADQVIEDSAQFSSTVLQGLDYAACHDVLLTLGVLPRRADTNFGYIQTDGPMTDGSPLKVKTFTEKPGKELAQVFIDSGEFLWNAGIFVWNVGTIANALRVYQPTLSKIFEDLLPIYGTEKEQDAINEVFPQCENISIDYAIMEKAEEIYVFPASFGWSDLGTWGSLHENSERDIYGNALIGENIDVYETTNCIVHATQEKRVVVQGLDGFIVAECDDTLLICRLSDEQRIKQFSESKE